MNPSIYTLLIATLLVWLAQAPAKADQHALLIGVSDYKSNRIADLEGPAHDVSALQKILQNDWNLNSANIISLVNQQANERNIKSAFRSLLDTTNAGDDIMIYFSGHGTSIKDKNFGAMLNLPHTSGALVTYDFDPAEHIARMNAGDSVNAENDGLLIGRYELKPLLQQLSKDRTVFVIFDSCFSGNTVRSLNRPYTPKQNRLLNITLGSESEPEVRTGITGASRCLNCTATSTLETPFEYSNVVYFGAAADNQLAIEHSQADIDAGLINTFDGKPHGGFSDALLRVLSNQSPKKNKAISYRTLFNLVVNTFNVNCANCAHNPVLLAGLENNVASKYVLSQNAVDADQSTPFTLASFDTAAQKPELQIAALNLGEGMSRAIGLLDSVQLNSITPDIALVLKGGNIEAQAADGQLISILPADSHPSRLADWLSAQAWMKARKLKDAQQNKGTIQASFRNPLTNPVAFAGESVYFTITLEKNAKLVVLITNSNGELSLLYPSTREEAEHVFGPAKTFKFPNQNDFNLKVVEPWGTDNVSIYALAANSDISASLIPLVDKPDFTRTEPLLTRFIQTLDSAETQYSTAHVRFHTTQ